MKNESGATLPRDGTVAEATSNILVFLEQLTEYTDTAGAVLQRNNEVDSTGSTNTKQYETQHRIALGHYLSK